MTCFVSMLIGSLCRIKRGHLLSTIRFAPLSSPLSTLLTQRSLEKKYTSQLNQLKANNPDRLPVSVPFTPRVTQTLPLPSLALL